MCNVLKLCLKKENSLKTKLIPFVISIIAPEKICQLYPITQELEAMSPGSKFTPDGHLFVSIGEVLVAYKYGLELLDNSNKTHNATAKDGKLIQINPLNQKNLHFQRA